jgi:hypothetical protein
MTHESAMTMVYDECYMPLLKHAKLGTIARVCRRGVPPFNPAMLIAMIDIGGDQRHTTSTYHVER